MIVEKQMVAEKKRLSIRALEVKDIAYILEIDYRISGVKRTPTYKALRAGDLGGSLDLSFVAEVNDEVVGFILGRHAYLGEPPNEAGLIQIIGVDPEYRRQRIASLMLIAMIDQAKKRGLKTLQVMVNERDSQMKVLFTSMDFYRGDLVDYIIEL